MPINDKKFNLQLDNGGKILNAMVQGFFQPADAEGFVVEYTKILSGINPKDFEFKLDCQNLKVTSQEMVPMLTACFEMYKKDGFKNVVFDCGANNILKMQLKRIGSTVGLPSYQIL